MGQTVLRANSSDSTLRAYAHCSADSYTNDSVANVSVGQITVLLINLEPTMPRTVTLTGLPRRQGNAGDNLKEWHLTGPNGTASTQMALHGKILEATPVSGGYKLPALDGRVVPGSLAGASVQVAMAPASISFIQVPASEGACSKAI